MRVRAVSCCASLGLYASSALILWSGEGNRDPDSCEYYSREQSVTYVTRHHREVHVFRIFFHKGTSWFRQRRVIDLIDSLICNLVPCDTLLLMANVNSTLIVWPRANFSEYPVLLVSLSLIHTHAHSAGPACVKADAKVRSVFRR